VGPASNGGTGRACSRRRRLKVGGGQRLEVGGGREMQGVQLGGWRWVSGEVGERQGTGGLSGSARAWARKKR
jgi:hypothetical protein